MKGDMAHRRRLGEHRRHPRLLSASWLRGILKKEITVRYNRSFLPHVPEKVRLAMVPQSTEQIPCTKTVPGRLDMVLDSCI